MTRHSDEKKILTAYAEQNGFVNLMYFVDGGYSGTNFGRPDFKRMIALAEQERFEQEVQQLQSELDRYNEHSSQQVKETLILSFAEIEDIIGKTLVKSAQTNDSYWLYYLKSY